MFEIGLTRKSNQSDHEVTFVRRRHYPDDTPTRLSLRHVNTLIVSRDIATDFVGRFITSSSSEQFFLYPSRVYIILEIIKKNIHVKLFVEQNYLPPE